MFAGIPATGIGGIFYLALVLFMPFKELWRAMKGESSAERWLFIASRWGLFAIVIAMMWVQALIMKWVMGTDMTKFMSAGASSLTGQKTTSIVGATLYLGVLCFISVIALMHGVRLFLAVKRIFAIR